MRKIIIPITLLLTVLLAACGAGTPAEPTATPVDINAIQTQAVQTVVAGVTQTALAMPTETLVPTETIIPTETLTLTPEATATATVNLCDNSVFVEDVSVTDGMQMTAGQAFVKTWKIKNVGSCTWTRTYTIRYGYGDRMSGRDTYLTAEILPNQEAEISVEMAAPSVAGTYRGYWVLFNNNGYSFGEYFSVIITVP
jgi:hypothetical protein